MIRNPGTWIPVRLGRYMLTNKLAQSIHWPHVRDQNRSGAQTPTQRAAPNTQRNKQRNGNSILDPSHVAGEQTAKRYSEGTSTGQTSWDFVRQTFIRSTGFEGSKNHGTDTGTERRFL